MGDRAEKRRKICRLLIEERNLVGAMFGFATCPNPAWDMLLDLYNAECEGQEIYLWSLSIAANVPVSSAHRKIQELVDKGWILRSSDDNDGRRVTVRLNATMMERVGELLDAVARLWPLEPLK